MKIYDLFPFLFSGKTLKKWNDSTRIISHIENENSKIDNEPRTCCGLNLHLWERK